MSRHDEVTDFWVLLGNQYQNFHDQSSIWQQTTIFKKQAKQWTRKKLVRFYLEHCIVWFRGLETKKIRAEVFGELWNVVLKENAKDKMAKGSNWRTISERLGEKRRLQHNILIRKANWTGHATKNKCLHDDTNVQTTEVKGEGRTRTQLLGDLRNERRYWELKEERKINKMKTIV